MRTKQQERARYTCHTVARFAELVGVKPAAIRKAVRTGWFGMTKDAAGRIVPEAQNTAAPGCRPCYHIHDNAVDRWLTDHAVRPAA